MPKDYATPRELAERLEVTEQVVTKWLRRGLIRGIRMGWRRRIPHAEVERVAREGVGVLGRQDQDKSEED